MLVTVWVTELAEAAAQKHLSAPGLQGPRRGEDRQPEVSLPGWPQAGTASSIALGTRAVVPASYMLLGSAAQDLL